MTSIPFEINHQESFPQPNFFLNTDGAKVPDFVSCLGKDKSRTLEACGLWMTWRDKTLVCGELESERFAKM